MTTYGIDELVKVDRLMLRLLSYLRSRIDRLGEAHEERLIHCAHKVAEKKAIAISKAEDRIDDLEDKQADLNAQATEARIVLQTKYKAALAALEQELQEEQAKLSTKLAAAATGLVNANRQYDEVVDAAQYQLGVTIDSV